MNGAATLLDALHDLPDAPVLVGFSGGMDSSVLLHLLAAARVPLRAVHVHHGLQPQADAWAEHCQRVCTQAGIALQLETVQVHRDSGKGIEAAARDARHAAFARALKADEVLALGHHRDDQAETFLLRALRGSGPEGLAAMPRWRRFAPGRLWRPLLDVARAQLLAYAHANDLMWMEDPSNQHEQLDRVFLRRTVLPLLRERWPQADRVLARNAQLQAQAADVLQRQDATDLAAVRGLDPATLDVAHLLRLPAERRARVLRAWIAARHLPALPGQGVHRIEQDLLPARADAEPLFGYSGTTIRRWRGLLHAGPAVSALPLDWQAEWNGRAPLQLPGGGQLRVLGTGALPATMQVHARRGGERIALPGRNHRHALKHVLQQIGLPPWERERLPLLSAADGQLLAAGDLVYSEPFDAWLRAHGARLQWTPVA